MEHLYPAGPASVPADLTRPTSAYRQRAWIAMAGLGFFVALYFALSGWFAWTAWQLLSRAFQGRDPDVLALGVGASSAFLAVFMIKAVFFVKHGSQSRDLEVTAQQQPVLFAFLHRLADEAGAPRPHRVYLSARVNAAVFYDLSIANLLLPSRKNLEIGLALVNVLTLGELKAVLAHEFGHFAQRSMAVGRWVYMAQQIAGHIVAKRDFLDKFLRFLSRIDLRVAWVGWLLSLVVWSIRSLMDALFRLVVLAQRALSREMELQADLVAVSLTGSDALVHALHRLHVADQAWERALGFAGGEFGEGRGVRDLFAVQTRYIAHLRRILDDPSYGEVPPLPADAPQQHRLFQQQLAQTPRMWATHPANPEREANAKRRYIPALLDERSAWVLFEDAQKLREQLSSDLLTDDARGKVQFAEPEVSLRQLDAGFDRVYLDPVYRGAYLGRSIVRCVRSADDLYEPDLGADATPPVLAQLYPPALAEALARLRSLEEEKSALEALKAGVLAAPGGVIRHRGREIRRTELPGVIAQLRGELDAVQQTVAGYDRAVRSSHLRLALAQGQGWPEYLRGLAAVLHYADHSEADLRDAQGCLSNVFYVVSADGRVSGRELKRLLKTAADTQRVLQAVHLQAREVSPDAGLLQKLGIADWAQAMGALELPAPDKHNIGQWMQAIDGWIGAAAGKLSALRHAALEQLLASELQLAQAAGQAQALPAAPWPSTVLARYPLLLPGSERARQLRLDLWDRFQLAEGLLPALARTAVACAVVGSVLVLGTVVAARLY